VARFDGFALRESNLGKAGRIFAGRARAAGEEKLIMNETIALRNNSLCASAGLTFSPPFPLSLSLSLSLSRYRIMNVSFNISILSAAD